MATGGTIALPEPLEGEDARSWFKRYEVCVAANGWNDQKKFSRLPTLLKGRAWAVYDSLHDEGDTDTYEHLKAAILKRLCPDTEEDRIVAREKLSRRRLREGESVDEIAREVEKLLDQASPGLPEELRESELRFYLINALPDKVSLQLKLQPKCSYADTIARSKELLLIYGRVDTVERVNQVQTKDDQRLQKLEETVQLMSEQLSTISVQRTNFSTANKCFRCGKRGHVARNCRASIQQVGCFNCGGQGHIAQNCWKTQGNGRGGTPTRRAGRAPGLN